MYLCREVKFKMKSNNVQTRFTFKKVLEDLLN